MLDVRKKIAPRKRVTPRPMSVVVSLGLKEQNWDIVPKMQTAVEYSEVGQTATAKLELIGIQLMLNMEPVIVITAQL